MTGQEGYKLIATEGFFEPRRVDLLSGVKVGERDDFVWAKVDRPFQENTLGKNSETNVVLLATRHYGYSLKQLSDLPLDIYVCSLKDSRLAFESEVEPASVSIGAWALLLAPDDDRENLEEIYESLTKARGSILYINPVHK